MADETSAGASPDGRAARVLKTGVALVHEGELILPAAGSEAEAAVVGDDARAVVEFHFPVEVEVSSAPETQSSEAIVEQALLDLARGIANS